MVFADTIDADALSSTRAVRAAPPAGCTLHVRMWEAPDSRRRVWGSVTHPGDMLAGAGDVAGLLDLVRFIVKEAACEAHVTLVKLSSRITHRNARASSARPT
jgi:hypothetical protein